uniref:hypothetical protein n=1 Tax=Salmonella sp. s51228 TaxID=3159652 RepID=UPI003980DABA
FNYLCCPRLGIPALIFAILGHESDKRNEYEAAKSHAYYTKIFNLLYCFFIWICCFACIVMIVLFVVGNVLVAETILDSIAALNNQIKEVQNQYDTSTHGY